MIFIRLDICFIAHLIYWYFWFFKPNVDKHGSQQKIQFNAFHALFQPNDFDGTDAFCEESVIKDLAKKNQLKQKFLKKKMHAFGSFSIFDSQYVL